MSEGYYNDIAEAGSAAAKAGRKLLDAALALQREDVSETELAILELALGIGRASSDARIPVEMGVGLMYQLTRALEAYRDEDWSPIRTIPIEKNDENVYPASDLAILCNGQDAVIGRVVVEPDGTQRHTIDGSDFELEPPATMWRPVPFYKRTPA